MEAANRYYNGALEAIRHPVDGELGGGVAERREQVFSSWCIGAGHALAVFMPHRPRCHAEHMVTWHSPANSRLRVQCWIVRKVSIKRHRGIRFQVRQFAQ